MQEPEELTEALERLRQIDQQIEDLQRERVVLMHLLVDMIPLRKGDYVRYDGPELDGGGREYYVFRVKVSNISRYPYAVLTSPKKDGKMPGRIINPSVDRARLKDITLIRKV